MPYVLFFLCRGRIRVRLKKKERFPAAVGLNFRNVHLYKVALAFWLPSLRKDGKNLAASFGLGKRDIIYPVTSALRKYLKFSPKIAFVFDK